jgi:hypothetical protein
MATPRRSAWTGLLVWTGLALLGLGCGDQPLETQNRKAHVTSVGPVEPNERFVEIQYTLRDREGDDQRVDVQICPADQVPGGCLAPVQGLGGDGTNRLPTVPEATDVPHRFSWRAGCGLVDGNQCQSADLQTSYVARIKVTGTNRSETSEPFTLGNDLQWNEVPTCDPRVDDVPAPCQPDDN